MTISLGDMLAETPFLVGNALSHSTTNLINSISIGFGMQWYGSPAVMVLALSIMTLSKRSNIANMLGFGGGVYDHIG